MLPCGVIRVCVSFTHDHGLPSRYMQSVLNTADIRYMLTGALATPSMMYTVLLLSQRFSENSEPNANTAHVFCGFLQF